MSQPTKTSQTKGESTCHDSSPSEDIICRGRLREHVDDLPEQPLRDFVCDRRGIDEHGALVNRSHYAAVTRA